MCPMEPSPGSEKLWRKPSQLPPVPNIVVTQTSVVTSSGIKPHRQPNHPHQKPSCLQALHQAQASSHCDLITILMNRIHSCCPHIKSNCIHLSRLWHPINPVPLHPIAFMHLLPVPLYVSMVPNYLYSLCITTDRWALCPVCLSIRLLNVFLFTIPVTNCSRPVILTNTIHLRESATNITELIHSAARTVLIDGLPNSLSITPYILQ